MSDDKELLLQRLEDMLKTLSRGDPVVIKQKWMELTIEPTERCIERLGNLIEAFKAGVISFNQVIIEMGK